MEDTSHYQRTFSVARNESGEMMSVRRHQNASAFSSAYFDIQMGAQVYPRVPRMGVVNGGGAILTAMRGEGPGAFSRVHTRSAMDVHGQSYEPRQQQSQLEEERLSQHPLNFEEHDECSPPQPTTCRNRRYEIYPRGNLICHMFRH